MTPIRFVLVGAGNVGTHLGQALVTAGHTATGVWSRVSTKAEVLAAQLGTNTISNLEHIPTADLIVLAVRDDAVPSVAAQLPPGDAVVVHTSGSVPMEVLAQRAGRFGVFYPLQTFSVDRAVDFRTVPLCLEGSDHATAQWLETLADGLTEQVHRVDSQQRQQLHLAAVFVCNFVNHMYAIGHELTAAHDLPFSLLQPLIEETAAKLRTGSPQAMQTGPARRGDRATMAAHLKLLEGHPVFQKIYTFVSNSIQEQDGE